MPTAKVGSRVKGSGPASESSPVCLSRGETELRDETSQEEAEEEKRREGGGGRVSRRRRRRGLKGRVGRRGGRLKVDDRGSGDAGKIYLRKSGAGTRTHCLKGNAPRPSASRIESPGGGSARHAASVRVLRIPRRGTGGGR